MNEIHTFINYIDYYLPEKVYTNDDLSKEFPEWPAEKIMQKVGISERHISNENETATDLAIKAAEKLFLNNSIDKSSIDLLLFCTQSPDYFLPSSACIVQNRLGLSTSCAAFDIDLGCSGYIYGLSIAKAYIQSGMAKNVLLLTGETYTKYIHERDKGNRSIFGDAGSATFISGEQKGCSLKVNNFVFGTDGSGFDKLIIQSGASRHKLLFNEISLNESGNPISGDYLYMDGGEIFNFTIDVVPKCMKQTLLKNGVEQTDISLFVFHQANKFILNYLRTKLKIEEKKFYFCLEKTGNTVSNTIPIALVEANKENKLNGRIYLTGFGVGLSWGGVIVEKIDS